MSARPAPNAAATLRESESGPRVTHAPTTGTGTAAGAGFHPGPAHEED